DVVDVGTVFAVRASAESLLTVRVTEGEVELRPAATRSTAARLRAGDAAVLEGARLVVRRREVMPADVNALAQGRLAFREASLGEVRDALRRWYGITLVIDDPALLDRHVTADFTAEPVRRVVTVLALALAADATWRGDTAVLRRSAAPPGR
ncbi:MAG: DUF4974 domain-containing protein, partial [Gemmatimonadaceae bacterium]|nr:DUF4974 domain-containing protein [Gemmatimonadaceae bacterium]